MFLINVKFPVKQEFDRPQYLVATPQIVSHRVHGDGWSPMGELQVG